MRISTVISSVVLTASLSGCFLLPSSSPAPTVDTSLYTDLPPVSTVSGYLIDPEAFFVINYNFPVDPSDPEGPPPPLLTNGIPAFEFSSASGANVSLVSGASETSSAPSQQDGVWQVFNVPTSDTTSYVLKAVPSDSGVALGAGAPYPSPVPLPTSKYVPTITLRDIVPSVPSCQFMITTLVREDGALTALAKRRTADGLSTTVADLTNPAKTRGVLLMWVFAPSFMLDWFQFQADQIQVTSTGNTIYALDWKDAGTGGATQSPLGFIATKASVSPIGYYAIVLPASATGDVSVEFTDKGSGPDPFGQRPWSIPPLMTTLQSGAVSVARVFSYPGGDDSGPPPTDTDDEPTPVLPGNDLGRLCFPP